MKTIDKIRSFLSLKDGWDFGAGIAFDMETVNRALLLEMVMREQGIPDTDAFPGADGGIMVTGYFGKIYVEYAVNTDGEVLVIVERDEEIVFEQTFSLKDDKSVYDQLKTTTVLKTTQAT